MESFGTIHPQRYLKFFGRPYEQCVCGISLKTTFIIIAIIDIVFAVTGFFSLMHTISWIKYLPFLGIIVLLIDLLDISLAVSAIAGIYGMQKLILG